MVKSADGALLSAARKRSESGERDDATQVYGRGFLEPEIVTTFNAGVLLASPKEGEGKEFVLYRLEDQQIQPDFLALSWRTTNDALSGLALQSLTNNNTYADDEVHRLFSCNISLNNHLKNLNSPESNAEKCDNFKRERTIIVRINATAKVRIRVTFSNRNGSKLKQVIAAKNTTKIGAEIGGNMRMNDLETVSMEFLAKIPKDAINILEIAVIPSSSPISQQMAMGALRLKTFSFLIMENC